MSGNERGRGSLHWRRPGLFLALTAALSAVACNQDGAPPRDVVQLDDGQVELPEGSHRHDVRIEGVGAPSEIAPATTEARPGDAIAFNAADGVTHSIVFVAERLDSAQVRFLDASGQMRGPPLLTEGSSWVVSLADAPAGDYEFACALHGGQGVVRVTAQ